MEPAPQTMLQFSCVTIALTPGMAAAFAESAQALSPVDEHGIASARALLDEAGGVHEAAAAGFADAAARWLSFGVPYEEAHALLGQGRCLVALRRMGEAAPVLERARVIFARLAAAPALAETEALLGAANSRLLR